MGVDLGSAYGRIEIGTDGAERSIQSLASSLRGLGTGLSIGLTAPLALLGRQAYKASADFETSFNVMGAVSGATAAELDTMREVALQLGADTVFSASEAAEAMLELSKAGLSSSQVMEAVPGVLSLAAAGNIELGAAAEIAANAVNAFKLDASETSRVADILAATANASSLEVDDLAMSFKMSAAVASMYGVSVEEVATALAIMGNNGIKGSDAGTSLKTMLMRLTSPTDKAAQLMGDLGLNVYNADGSMRGFEDILANLVASMEGLTDQQRDNALTDLFGADAIRAAGILMDNYASSWDTMKDSVTAAGAAQEVASARMGGLNGAIERFKGAVETAMIQGVTPFNEALANIVDTGTRAVEWFTELPPHIQKLGVYALMAAALLGPLLLVLSSIIGVLAGISAPVWLVIAAVTALGLAWATNFMGIREKTAAAWEAIKPHLDAAAGWLKEKIPQALGWLLQRWNEIWGALSTAAGAAWTALQPIIAEIGAWLRTKIPQALDWLKEKWGLAWGWIKDKLALAWAGLLGVLGQISAWFEAGGLASAWDTLKQTWATVWDSMKEKLTTAWAGIQAILAFFQPAWDRLKQALSGVGEQLSTLGPQWDALKESISGLVQSVLPHLAALLAGVGAVVGVTLDLIINTISSILSRLGAIIGGAMQAVTGVINAISLTFAAATDIIGLLIDGDWAGAWERAKQYLVDLDGAINEVFTGLATFIGEIILAIKDAVVQTLEDMGVDTEALLNGIKAFWESVWTTISGFPGLVKDAIELLETKIEQFRTWWNGLTFNNIFQGLKDAADTARQAIASVMGGAPSGPPDGDGRAGARWQPLPTGGGVWVPEGRAKGSSFFPGGSTIVGERGPELVTLPRGAGILTAAQTHAATAGAVGNGDTINITIPATIRQDIDVHRLAWAVADEIKRKRR